MKSGTHRGQLDPVHKGVLAWLLGASTCMQQATLQSLQCPATHTGAVMCAPWTHGLTAPAWDP